MTLYEWLTFTITWVLGIGGAVTGIIGIVMAMRANKTAKDSLEQAAKANKIAEEANEISRGANKIAEGAHATAEETKAIHVRAEARETERNDVRWDYEWESPGDMVLTNKGDDDALNVKAVVTVEDEEVVERQAVVAGKCGQLHLDFPEVERHAAGLRRERAAEAQARRLAAETKDPMMQRMLAMGPKRSVGFDMVMVTLEITWDTPNGSPRTYKPKSYMQQRPSY